MTVNMMGVTSVDMCPPTRRCATRFHTRKRHNLLEAEGGLAALEEEGKVELEADLSLLVDVVQPHSENLHSQVHPQAQSNGFSPGPHPQPLSAAHSQL